MLYDSDTRKALGNAGEQAVGKWLQEKGFTILCFNYSTRGGEVDIIAQCNEIVSFVEVKVRTTDYFNSSQLITPEKQRKIIQTARIFCVRHKLYDVIIRFDVALVQPAGNDFEITYLSNAFTDMSKNSL